MRFNKFSKDTQDIIAMTRKVAERYGNNFIGVGHFLLCFNKYNQNGRLQICISLNEKKDLIKYIKGKRYEGIKGDDYPLTKEMEIGLKSSSFHCWIMGDKLILPEHIYLGILATEIRGKGEYLSLLKQRNISLNKLKHFLINTYFNELVRKSGIVKFLY